MIELICRFFVAVLFCRRSGWHHEQSANVTGLSDVLGVFSSCCCSLYRTKNGSAAYKRHAQPFRRDGHVLQRMPRRRCASRPMLRRICPSGTCCGKRAPKGTRRRLTVAVYGGRRHVPRHAVLFVLQVAASRRLYQSAETRRHGKQLREFGPKFVFKNTETPHIQNHHWGSLSVCSSAWEPLIMLRSRLRSPRPL